MGGWLLRREWRLKALLRLSIASCVRMECVRNCIQSIHSGQKHEIYNRLAARHGFTTSLRDHRDSPDLRDAKPPLESDLNPIITFNQWILLRSQMKAFFKIQHQRCCSPGWSGWIPGFHQALGLLATEVPWFS